MSNKYVFNTYKIENFIEVCGWTTDYFCKECNISKEVYKKLLQQDLSISSRHLMNIAKVIGVKMQDLLIKVDK